MSACHMRIKGIRQGRLQSGNRPNGTQLLNSAKRPTHLLWCLQESKKLLEADNLLN